MLTLGTGHCLLLPVHLKVRDIEGIWRACLPTRIGMHWPHEINRILVTTLQNPFGADLASVNQLFLRQQLLGRQLRLDGLERMVILWRRGWGFDQRDEMWQIVVAALGHMHFVTDPVEIALAPVAHLGIVGRALPRTDVTGSISLGVRRWAWPVPWRYCCAQVCSTV